MLRDMVSDIADGYINIPREYLEDHDMSPEEMNSPPFRAWVRGQVEQAREYFVRGKRYLEKLDILRCQIAGYWYCARFEAVLNTIERDEYVLRSRYDERRKLSAWLKMLWLAIVVTLRYCVDRLSRPPGSNRIRGDEYGRKQQSGRFS
jgi:phytoene/squalene synthetase